MAWPKQQVADKIATLSHWIIKESGPMMFPFKLRKKLIGQRGSTLVAVFIVGVVLIIAGLAFFSIGAYEAHLHEQRRASEQAFCRAESAVEKARWVLIKTKSKSAALMDTLGMEVFEVNEIDGAGQVVNAGVDEVSYDYDVRVRARGTERQQQRELMVIFEPGLTYAVATGQHITFHGTSNDWSAADAMDHVNDVYLEGGLVYDHHINHPDHPWKYDWARPDVIIEPDYMTTLKKFSDYFKPQADITLQGNQFWGWDGDDWQELDEDARIVFVKGKVDINLNVWDNWDDESHDVTILATGDITVTNGINGDDDRLILISTGNVILEGSGAGYGFNGFIMAGNKVVTKGLSGGGLDGGEGEVRGMVYFTFDIDMRGYDPEEIYPFRRGWKITQRLDTITMNGGIQVVPTVMESILTFHRKSWAEIPPEA
jgi:hypothetical protein